VGSQGYWLQINQVESQHPPPSTRPRDGSSGGGLVVNHEIFWRQSRKIQFQKVQNESEKGKSYREIGRKVTNESKIDSNERPTIKKEKS
jgi:hypothetical protein